MIASRACFQAHRHLSTQLTCGHTHPAVSIKRNISPSAAHAAATTNISTGALKVSQMKLDGFMQRIKDCNVGLEELPTLTPFIIEGKTMGKLKPRFVQQLTRFPQVFEVCGPEGPTGRVQLVSGLDTCDKRTIAVAGVLEALRSEGYITGWRNELYPVTSSFYDQPAMLVERAAAVHFGIKAYGVHINGYVEDEQGGQKLWIARRSMTKPNWPGKLDHIVAGGQPHGLSVLENVVKECEEEASIPLEVARTARPVGCVSYTTISEIGLKPDVLFVYDIKLSPSFVPKPLDGEVEWFKLLPVDEVAELVATTSQFKTNCNLVIIDFLVRHGHITPDQPGYLELVGAIRGGDCS